MFYKKQEVRVIEQRPMLSQIEIMATGRTLTVRNDELSDIIQTIKINHLLAPVLPAELSSAFLVALSEVSDKVAIRVHYPKHAEQSIQAAFSQAGIVLPPDIRPLDSGLRGGQTIQRDWAAVVWFPLLPGVPTPEGTKADTHTPGFLINSRRDVVLGILKAGFVITDYTRVKEN